MPAASRVVLVPPERWDEPRLADAARSLPRPRAPLRPGDAVGGLVVLGVAAGAALAPDAGTVFEVRAAPRAPAGPLHLAVLLDASESMALPWSAEYARIDAAREALTDSLRASGDRLGGATVFTFAREVRLVAGPLTPAGTRQVKLDPVKARGPARTGDALDAALAHLAAQSDPPDQAILLLTDAPGDAKALAAAAERAARLRVPVHVVAFAPEVDPALRKLAESTGGTAQRATLPLGFDLPPRGT
jgi:predicted RNA-binding Zn ribbon-like protein